MVLSPLCLLEGLATFVRSGAALPRLNPAPHVDRVHRVLWTTIEAGPMNDVVPLWPWRMTRLFTRSPSPGLGIATLVARREVLAQLERGHLRGSVHAATLGLTVWLTRHATGEQLAVAAADSMYFGRTAHGVEQGAQLWFGKQPRDLSWAQAATLAGLVQNPQGLDPACRSFQAMKRRHFLLSRLRDLKVTTQREFEDADAEPLLPVEGAPRCEPKQLRSTADGELEIVPDE